MRGKFKEKDFQMLLYQMFCSVVHQEKRNLQFILSYTTLSAQVTMAVFGFRDKEKTVCRLYATTQIKSSKVKLVIV